MVFWSFFVRHPPSNVTMNSTIALWGQYTRGHRLRVSKREQTHSGTV